ncbi:MAG: hypothetical protein IKY02_05200 [Lachnospiraceae bacterium]|nr:hypothetical protein [Lachnospiraceae bacterium]
MTESKEQLKNYCVEHAIIGNDPDVLEVDGQNVVYLLEHCEFSLTEDQTFFVRVNVGDASRLVFKPRLEPYLAEPASEGFRPGIQRRAYTGSSDFGHTTTEWETVIKLGIAGLRDRLKTLLSAPGNDEKAVRFYENSLKVYNAALAFMGRAADYAASQGKERMAEGLRALTKRAPANLFEALQTVIVYYDLQHFFEGTYLRTLGRPDRYLLPFYRKEDPEAAFELLKAFMREINSMKAPANMPFALGGSDEEGSDLFNELSFALLKAYQESPNSEIKLHILWTKASPDRILTEAFRGVRDGSNSIVFMQDSKVIEAIEKLGAAHEDAVDYHVVGCYECGARGEITSSCTSRVSLPKALEAALNDGCDMETGERIGLPTGKDPETFEDFYRVFRRELLYFVKCAIRITDLREQHYPKFHSAPILSAVYDSSVRAGRDIYADYGAKYNNSSVNAIGLATAADSLYAIRKLVYEDRSLTLSELKAILKSDWAGQETLRLTVRNRFPKFGNGDPGVDSIAKRIVDDLSRAVNGTPNVKGGVYRLGLFSIDWRWEFGEKTAASADGRHAHETLSQNTSASFGMDREGATAHLISVASIDPSRTPNGTIVDIDLHSSAVEGEEGLRMLVGALKAYFELGGFAVHYNILNTETLKKAKAHPEDYPNLQVRLCGWNVLFSTLTEKEKDEFIARSEKEQA